MRFALVLLAFVPGCYESHVRVEPDRCAPDGTHTVIQRVVDASPGCGMIGEVGALAVTLPPVADDIFLGADDPSVTPIEPCLWAAHAETLIPDASSVTDGTIDTRDGTLRGTFHVSFSGIAGVVCELTLEWEETGP
jgi:hypothetical protein